MEELLKELIKIKDQQIGPCNPNVWTNIPTQTPLVITQTTGVQECKIPEYAFKCSNCTCKCKLEVANRK